MSDKTCPSGRCREGSLLLGVVGEEGTQVTFLRPAVPVDAEFAATAVEPQRRFRFAEPCATTSCRQWSGGRCGVIDEVLSVAEAAIEAAAAAPSGGSFVALDGPLSYCAIRSTCRWFHQSGRAACRVCRYVVTDTTDQPVDQPVEQPIDQPADQRTDRPVGQPADQPTVQPVGV